MNGLLLALAVVLNVGAQIALKAAAARHALTGWRDAVAAAGDWRLFAALALYGLSVINWLVVLRRMELSVAYPAMSLGYVLALAAGAWCFDERITAIRIAGVGCILVGVVLVTRSAHG